MRLHLVFTKLSRMIINFSLNDRASVCVGLEGMGSFEFSSRKFDLKNGNVEMRLNFEK